MDAGFLDVLHDAADDDGARGIRHAVDVEFLGVFEEAIEEDRPVVRDVDGRGHVTVERGHVVDDGHVAATEHVRRAHHHGEADLGGHLAGFGARHGRAARRLRDAEIPQQLRETLAVFGEVDRVGRRADDRHARLLQRQRELERRLTAELHHHRDLGIALPFAVDDRHHVFERERLEVQPVGRVVVGRHGFRIAVDHHRLEAVLLEAEDGMAAAVVELEPLPDAVGTAAEDDHLAGRRRRRLAFLLVGAVHVRRERLELGRAGVDALVGGPQAELGALLAHRRLVHLEDVRQVLVAEAGALQRAQQVGRHIAQADERRGAAQFDQLGELLEEPRVDLRELVDPLGAPAAFERLEDRPHATVGRNRQTAAQAGIHFIRCRVFGACPGLLPGAEEAPLLAEFQRPEALQERFLEGAPDRHRLAHRLHLRRERAVGLRELLEVPARNLDDDVVDRRFEGRRREARDVVRDLVEVIAERELGGNLRNREPGGLRRQRRAARDARVHLDDDHAAVGRVDGELDVRAARLDADAADDATAGIAHPLVFLVAQRERRGHGDAVAGVHAHRVDVLDRADDDEVVGDIAHHLEFEFLPADHRFLDEHFVHRAHLEAAAADFLELLDVVGDAAADAAHRERRADDGREAGVLHRFERFGHRLHDGAPRHIEAELEHRVVEELTVFGHLDGGDRRADELDAVLLEHAGLVQRHREVERRLAADRGQNRIRLLARDDAFDHVHRERLDVGAVGHLRVRHDRRRVAVDEHHLEAFVAKGLDGLGAGVIELTRLADDDRAGADDEDALQICASRHGWRVAFSAIPSGRRTA